MSSTSATSATSEKSATLDPVTEIQNYFVDRLKANAFMTEHEIAIIPENAGDLEYQVDSAIGKFGTCLIVATPKLSYFGRNEDGTVWRVEDLSLIVSEIPTTNRGRANYATAMSTAVQAAEILKGSECIPKTIIQQDTNGLITVTATFLTTFTITITI